MAGSDIDLSKVPLEDLVTIHNQVLRQIAANAKLTLDPSVLAAGHDSHSSNHSNNKITDRVLQESIDRLQQQRLGQQG